MACGRQLSPGDKADSMASATMKPSPPGNDTSRTMTPGLFLANSGNGRARRIARGVDFVADEDDTTAHAVIAFRCGILAGVSIGSRMKNVCIIRIRSRNAADFRPC